VKAILKQYGDQYLGPDAQPHHHHKHEEEAEATEEGHGH
jgi:hypothetical protein